MSWSVAAIGKSDAVKKDIAAQFVRGGKCVEPEESIRQEVAKIINTAVGSIHNSFVVKVAASGSQGYKNYNKPEDGVYNVLNISVEVVHGFVE